MWGKGHTPGISDPLIGEAVKNFNMMETGFTIKPADLSKLQVELVNMIQGKIGEKEMKEQRKMKKRMTSSGGSTF